MKRRRADQREQKLTLALILATILLCAWTGYLLSKFDHVLNLVTTALESNPSPHKEF